ncbi:MAG: copper resistance protein NlpE N-terminal domain-containing protein [Chitinophagaceae bacterium]|nr:copper resistance protein NlpE N-terminal domain-containing protein [Chitinophagaceae bacterium]
MQLKWIIVSLTAATLVACGGNDKQEEVTITDVKLEEAKPAPETALPADTFGAEATASTALDWNGVYKGTLPCADCQGIETTLTLNADKTYGLLSTYIGKGDGKPVESKGSFEWINGNVVKLNDPRGAPQLVMISENKVLMLDRSGQKVTGQLADKYILVKVQ